jgi:predicted nucleic acid-binding protein
MLHLDANVFMSAVLGTRVRRLIEQYGNATTFVMLEPMLREADVLLPRVASARNVDPTAYATTYQAMVDVVEMLPPERYLVSEAEARKRMNRRDPDDWSVLAAALALECPIWTEDRDFFGVGVPTWATDLVELYLKQEAGLN